MDFRASQNEWYELGRRRFRLRDSDDVPLDREVWHELARLGLFRRHVPLAEGGDSGSLASLLSMISALGAGGLDLSGLTAVVHQLLLVDALVHFGSRQQKERYLKDLMNGTLTGAVCHLEWRGASSRSPGGTLRRSTLRMTEPPYALLEAEKHFERAARDADLFLISVWREPKVELVLIERPEATLGFDRVSGRGLLTTSRVVDTEGRQLGGGETRGGTILRHLFYLEQVIVAGLLGGMLDELVREALLFMEGRTSFGRPLSEYRFAQEKALTLFSIRRKLSGLLHGVVGERASKDLTRFPRTLSVLKIACLDDVGQALSIFAEIYGSRLPFDAGYAPALIRDHSRFRFLSGSRDSEGRALFEALVRSTKHFLGVDSAPKESVDGSRTRKEA